LFQFLTGIVHLRLKQTPDPVARDQLAWGLEVIRAVSLWRPLLEAQSIRIEADTERLELGSDLSSSLALIVQELLTNSAKHAFKGAGGVVRIGLESRGSEAELTVTDNGQGRASTHALLPRGRDDDN
jgi:signal transduction histidine kinase